MTGGQVSPTMAPTAIAATTAPYGQVERAFDLCRLVEAAGATFVARGMAADIRSSCERLISDGITHQGLLVHRGGEPVSHGVRQAERAQGQVAMLDDQKARAITVAKAAKLPPEELEGQIVTGVLHRTTRRRSSGELRGHGRAGARG